jgi:hypothetical protein
MNSRSFISACSGICRWWDQPRHAAPAAHIGLS